VLGENSIREYPPGEGIAHRQTGGKQGRLWFRQVDLSRFQQGAPRWGEKTIF